MGRPYKAEVAKTSPRTAAEPQEWKKAQLFKVRSFEIISVQTLLEALRMCFHIYIYGKRI